MNYLYSIDDSYYLSHHGIKGQKWGVRRWQNSDGSLTEAGREHYGKGLPRVAKSMRERGLAKTNKRIDKGNKKLYKAEQRYAPAYNKATAAKKQLAKEQSKYDSINRKLDRAENGLGAKLIGKDGYKINKLNRQLDRQNDAVTKAQDRYNLAEATREQRKAKINQVERYLDKQDAKKRKQINDYIRRYGQEEYNSIK